MATRDYTVRLDEGASTALEAEARRRQVAPDALASELVRERLPERTEGMAEQMEAALAGLAAVRAKVKGPVDAVALVREGREELERRSLRWLSS